MTVITLQIPMTRDQLYDALCRCAAGHDPLEAAQTLVAVAGGILWRECLPGGSEHGREFQDVIAALESAVRMFDANPVPAK